MTYPPAFPAGYSDAELVVGTVTALRVWGISWRRELVGCFSQPWHPGENVAECLRSTVWLGGPFGVARRPRPGHDKAVVPYSDCGCGFWAFWPANQDPERLPFSQGYRELLGVAECYGRAIEGELGLRCEKARIVALAPFRRFGEMTDEAREVLRPFLDDGTDLFDDWRAMVDGHTFTDPPPEDSGR